uniref:Uncharacterized protein n=1 Tax=Oryza punctata TaxID=4537 RepID=A0A0E0MLX3_ORYPU
MEQPALTEMDNPHPPAIIWRPSVASKLGRLSAGVDVGVDAGRVSGLVFVSERKDGLETLHVALRFAGDDKPQVFGLADIFGDADFCGVRMEDVGGVGGGYKKGSRTVDHSLVYVSTKEPVQDRRRPWTVVYKTNLKTGKTERLTPADVFDLSPAVSPSGKRVAVASFQGKPWDGEVEDLQTDIYLMNVDKPPLDRSPQPVIRNGGWPTWGSDDVLFFHRRVDTGRGEGSIPRHFHKLQSPHEDVGLFRVSGVFPTISKDGSMLAFVDNEFKAVWVADNQGLRIIHKCTGPNSVFSPMWNQKKDTLYVCMGPSFSANDPLEIHAFFDVSERTGRKHRRRRLTEGGFNNAFPSSSPDGTRFVFRSTRDDIDPDDIEKNRDVDAFRRVTHSRYENSTPAWTTFATDDPYAQWNVLVTNKDIISYKPACPYAYPGGGESWHMTGHLCLGQHRRCC